MKVQNKVRELIILFNDLNIGVTLKSQKLRRADN